MGTPLKVKVAKPRKQFSNPLHFLRNPEENLTTHSSYYRIELGQNNLLHTLPVKNKEISVFSAICQLISKGKLLWDLAIFIMYATNAAQNTKLSKNHSYCDCLTNLLLTKQWPPEIKMLKCYSLKNVPL